ncbi:MAG TPA: heptosyltransferase, partial [Usitatibacter sp.]|nr:heptosyltransferase [Usitatibacter sp.]
MGERFATRALVVSRALAHAFARKAAAAGEPRRVLVAHNLLLGDTLMLTPLLAKIRARLPSAETVLLAAPAYVPLYSGRPYGVRALPFAPAR